MEKSMYSLILLDDVVKAVDQLASAKGTSRSNLISQILAEHLSLLTPEKRVDQIFGFVEEFLQDYAALSVLPRPSATAMHIKGSLHYKYNPAIRYVVEVTVSGSSYIGAFRAACRTSSEELKSKLSIFFELWSRIEQSALEGAVPSGVLRHKVGGGRFDRVLIVEDEGTIYDSELLGSTIAEYIRVMDHAMQVYFSAKHGVDMATFGEMTRLYGDYINNGRAII